MYKSPIEIIQHRATYDCSKRLDEAVFTAVVRADIHVERDELIKALQYDRDQYQKGFEDGKSLVSQWISVKDRLPVDPRSVLVHVRHPAVLHFSAWSCIMTDMWLGDKWAENADDEVHEVTHWMQLPEPPKEE